MPNLPIIWRCRRCGQAGRVAVPHTPAGPDLGEARAAAQRAHDRGGRCAELQLELSYVLARMATSHA